MIQQEQFVIHCISRYDFFEFLFFDIMLELIMGWAVAGIVLFFFLKNCQYEHSLWKFYRRWVHKATFLVQVRLSKY